jgi:predicted phage baseplate assembly protein
LSVKPVKEVSSFTALDNLLKGNLANPPAVQVAGSAFLTRNVSDALTLSSDTLPQILSVLKPAIAPTLYAAWANSATTIAQPAQVFAFRVKASPFGSVAPLKPITNAQGAVTGTEEWPIADTTIFGVEIANSARGGALLATTVATAGFTLNGQTQKAAVTFPVAPATTATTQLGNNASVVVSGPAADGSFAFAFSLPSSANVATPTINIFPLTANATQQVQINQDASVSVSVGHPNTYSTTAYAATVRLSIEASALTVEVAVPLLDVMFLDAQYSQIQQNTYAAIMRSDNSSTLVSNVTGVQNIAKAAYGITGKSTRLTLDQDWLSTLDTSLAVMRGTTVYAQSEQLTLAQQPYDPDSSNNPADVKGTTIELDDLYDGLTSGRWIIVSGERTDVLDANGNVVPGITASELAMIAGVTQSFNPKLPGDQIHTTITLATALAYTYSRSTVTVYGNVVDATNGATTNETMGSGDGSQELQSFALKQPPLTFVAAPTPAGAASTLEVYVNNVQWQEVDTLAGLGPKDRNFVTQTDDNAITTVIFGDGTQGARLPTGVGNVQAVYRKGIGQPGNVAAGEITMLTSPPLGVQSVLNPLDASGGADSDDIDQARANAPVAVLSLDRLVSVQDYADFSRTFAGIGKAASVRLSDGLRELVFITIAGADDVPIATTSDLYNNLLAALVNYGDPALPVQVGVRALKLMVISANVGLLSDYQWDSVALAIRTALLSAFSFTTIDLATPVRLSEVISVMQAVGGVEYVDILSFGSIPENFTASDLAKLTAAKKVGNSISSLPARSGTSSTDGGSAAILPAQLVYLSPAVPDTLILNQII